MDSITYTRRDIIRKLSYKLNLNDEESKFLFDNVLTTINDLLTSSKRNVRIELRNFGIFSVYKTKERTNARNPQTRESVTIPPRKRVVFKPSKKMKVLLNKKLEIN